MKAARAAAGRPQKTTKSTHELQKLQKWTTNIAKTSVEISRMPSSTDGLPESLLGRLLHPQEFEARVQGWVEGAYHPERVPGRMVRIPLRKVAGVFQWTRLGETDHQTREENRAVGCPDLSRLGKDKLIYFSEKNNNVRME